MPEVSIIADGFEPMPVVSIIAGGCELMPVGNKYKHWWLRVDTSSIAGGCEPRPLSTVVYQILFNNAAWSRSAA
jgi:hypothetical protein